MDKKLLFIVLIFAGASSCSRQESPAIYSSSVYNILRDRVEQGAFQAIALNSTEIVSDYQSAGNDFMSPRIDFKFSINGKDNEMLSGRDHHFNCIAPGNKCETPLIRFGEQLNDDSPLAPGVYLQPDTEWTIRLDMRHVFEAFQRQGYFETFNGSRIYKEDFKGVYVAGGTVPLTWDFDNLEHFRNLELHDEDGDHIYELVLILNAKEDKRTTDPRWELSSPIGEYPQHESAYPIVDALYNLALEEMTRAVEPDSTLRTGKEWAGVWTRDVSYSIILSMAILQTKTAQYSLLRKVQDGVIIQDTGTGGAYPVSTDRMIWAVAAWEIYKVTGDQQWLETVYPIIRKSIEADLENALDKETGLFKGESSFLDWREQTYPDWMEPADIYQSLSLGTNAVHYQANVVLSAIARALNHTEVAEKHERIADDIRDAINEHLWLDDRSYYAQYLYGRTFRIASPRSEALGEALCVLFGIADAERAARVVAHTPVNDFGIPCIYPQIPHIPPYHNDGIWPFVQSYWTMAAAKAGNENAVLESLAAIWRPASLFLTNKENFVASTGDFAATQINSDNMLWSLAGNIGMVYKVLFGIQYDENSIVFKPFVPEALKGIRTLRNYRYRDAILDIEMEGFGNEIRSITLDGQPLKDAVIPATLEGSHHVKIILSDTKVGGEINKAGHHVSPVTPGVSREGSAIKWNSVQHAVGYQVIRNGTLVGEQSDTSFHVDSNEFSEYQVIAFDHEGHESFASQPVTVTPRSSEILVEAESSNSPIANHHRGFSGTGYVHTSLSKNSGLKFPVSIPTDGTYAIDIRYANGHGPVNTENKCAIRTMKVDDRIVGTIVLPQRGKEEWSDWGFSNSVIVDLKKGTREVKLDFELYNANMNREINEAIVDFVRVIRVN